MSEQKSTELSKEPKAERPVIPKDYGIPKSKKGMLEWSVVNGWLEGATIYWLATASIDGKPHATPIWGLWADGGFYFDGSPETVWVRNLTANPRLVVHIENGSGMVILEGEVERATVEADVFKRLADQSEAKYKSRPESVEGNMVMRPRKVMAWDHNAFGQTATRWRFDRG